MFLTPTCRWLSPLKPLGVPTQRIALTLLLSLRFMSLVFEEVRNLCLGLAARGVDWRAQGGRGSLEIVGRLVVRLFGNLFTRSEKISQVSRYRALAAFALLPCITVRTVHLSSVLGNLWQSTSLQGYPECDTALFTNKEPCGAASQPLLS